MARNRTRQAPDAEQTRNALRIKDHITSALNMSIKDRPDCAMQLGYMECLLEFARTFGCEPGTFAMASALAQVTKAAGVPDAE